MDKGGRERECHPHGASNAMHARCVVRIKANAPTQGVMLDLDGGTAGGDNGGANDPDAFQVCHQCMPCVTE